MPLYPSGTVTFLFTDIEGSTKLAQEYTGEWPALLAVHNDILQRAIEACNGYIYQVVGDSFAAAFHNASDSLNAALQAQRSLQQQAWSPVPLRVRMGIHTGAANLETDGHQTRYVGYTTLAVTQRIMAAAHGGQVLLSQPARDLVIDNLPDNAELRDMGEHRLKDVAQAEHLYQLAIPGLLSDFQPLNTLNAFNHNLPTQLTSFVGRATEIEALKKLVGEHRLVTVTGSGGCGKTRLTIEVAGELLPAFAHGVWLVELSPVTDPALVPQAVITAFALRTDPRRSDVQVLTDYLRSKNILLILDNCEHIVEAAAGLAESLLRSVANLKILTSSREPLGIAGEVAYRVPSLRTPNPEHLPALNELCQMDAIQLFLERGGVAKPDFALTAANARAVAQICARLDGIPLAIELAAARLRVLSAEQIATRLDDRFRLLTGGARTALPRQQTLRAMIDWSYSFLSDAEKMLFCRLAVFVGGWTLEAAESTCDEKGGEPVLDLLTRLVDKSLVNTEDLAGETRYRYLETIRQYAREKLLESDEVQVLRDRHLAFYVGFAGQMEIQLEGSARKEWAQRSEAEQGNLRAAVEWGLARDPASALRIAAHLVLGMAAGGFSIEGFQWLRDGMLKIQATVGAEQPALRAKALSGLSYLYLSMGDNLNSKQLAQESIAIYRTLDDRLGLAHALLMASYPTEFLGDLVQAEALLHEALPLARAEKNGFAQAWALNTLARIAAKRGDLAAASHYADEAHRVSEDAGIEYNLAMNYEMKGVIAAQRGNYAEACTLFEQAQVAFESVGAHFNALLNKSNLAHLERQFGHLDRALVRYRDTIVAFRDVGQVGAVAHQLECFGFIALAQEQGARAAQLFGAAQALREHTNTPMTPEEQVYYDDQVQRLRSTTDPTTFEAAWSHGRTLSMDDAVGLATASEFARL
jgi:predicted ATPase/class 3 adenylate cyclase